MHQSLEHRRAKIQHAVSDLTPGGQRRYPPRLRAQIVDYARDRLRAGGLRREVCTELGVSDPTLVRLLGETRPCRLRPVRVVDTRAEIAPAPQRQPIVVRAAGGLLIEGLDLDGVAALVRALS